MEQPNIFLDSSLLFVSLELPGKGVSLLFMCVYYSIHIEIN